MKNTMVNNMGSEVEVGFTCKPKVFDPNKPIMHFKTQIFICDGERCKQSSKHEDEATFLRELLKELNLHQGQNRIKISRTNCFGACRFRQVATVFENTKANGFIQNNNIWLKNTHKFDKNRWIELFTALKNNKNLDELDFEQIPMNEIS
ncbi:(2Fe-2S) ferredoxin domain-containing protein [Sulfurospirillum arcachonense]|uniref:(2Fe-2S) ferredoxin domain-containing protein n=1 Tax=Sulfurospirillum arcachonense TaxID=57666 RepID=UPI0012EBC787|nr:(2Fe-2S) ferredoxin domain-containing protein [Sulfurospirillum arcachonense]